MNTPSGAGRASRLASHHLLVPDWQAPSHVRAVFTTRAGGVSQPPFGAGRPSQEGSAARVGGGLNLAYHVGDEPAQVAENRARFQALLGAGRRAAWLDQVHGAEVFQIDAEPGGTRSVSTRALACADASVTRARRTACVIMVADCLPVLLTDASGRAVGAAHAGWRGLAAGVIERTVDAVRALAAQRGASSAGDGMLAWLGPAIGPRAFEVGPEVREHFLLRAAANERDETAAAFKPAARVDKHLCDLYALARLRLRRNGVERVSGGDFCTFSDSRFFSYRRDGRTGRMAAAVWLE